VVHATEKNSAESQQANGLPESDGSSQFQRCITASPPIQIKAGIATIARGAIRINFSDEGKSARYSPA